MNGSDDDDDGLVAREGEQNEGTWELVSDAEEAEGAADEDWNHDGEVDSNATLWDSPASSEHSNPFSNPQRRRWSAAFYRTFDDSINAKLAALEKELTERVVNPVIGFVSNSAVRSRQATEHVSLEFHNATNVQIRVIWMDYTGVPRQRHSVDIEPGRVRVTSTYEGHPWTSYTLDGERTQLLMNGSTVLWPRRERGMHAHVCEIKTPTQEDDSSSQNPEPVSLSSPSLETSAHGSSADLYSDLDIQQFARRVKTLMVFSLMIWGVYKLIRFVA